MANDTGTIEYRHVKGMDLSPTTSVQYQRATEVQTFDYAKAAEHCTKLGKRCNCFKSLTDGVTWGFFAKCDLVVAVAALEKQMAGRGEKGKELLAELRMKAPERSGLSGDDLEGAREFKKDEDAAKAKRKAKAAVGGTTRELGADEEDMLAEEDRERPVERPSFSIGGDNWRSLAESSSLSTTGSSSTGTAAKPKLSRTQLKTKIQTQMATEVEPKVYLPITYPSSPDSLAPTL